MAGALKPISMEIIGGVVESNVEAFVPVTEAASGAASGTVQQHGAPGAVNEVAIHVTVPGAGKLQRRFNLGDICDGRRNYLRACQPGGRIVRDLQAYGEVGAGGDCLGRSR